MSNVTQSLHVLELDVATVLCQIIAYFFSSRVSGRITFRCQVRTNPGEACD